MFGDAVSPAAAGGVRGGTRPQSSSDDVPGRSAVWHGLEEVPALDGSVVAIGVFDGVHRGHRLLLERARVRADELHLPLVAVTFDPHPMAVVRPGAAPPMLSTLEHRVELLLSAGADAVLIVRFTPEFGAWSPEDFVEKVLVQPLAVRHVVVGDNFRFGRRAAGDVETLEEAGQRWGFGVDDVPLAARAAEPWSSTYVRGLIAGGDVAAAADALGRPFRLQGVVVHGDHRGRELGYPTANISVHPEVALPADGVYAAWFVHGGEQLPAAVSVGTNPQFDGREVRVEAFVLDRPDFDSFNVYGCHVAVDLVGRIRGQAVFDTLDGLLARMAEDVAESRRLLGC